MYFSITFRTSISSSSCLLLLIEILSSQFRREGDFVKPYRRRRTRWSHPSHSHSLSCTHSLSLIHSLNLTLSLTHSITHSLSLSFTLIPTTVKRTWNVTPRALYLRSILRLSHPQVDGPCNRHALHFRHPQRRGFPLPLSSERGTHKPVTARFWPWLDPFPLLDYYSQA